MEKGDHRVVCLLIADVSQIPLGKLKLPHYRRWQASRPLQGLFHHVFAKVISCNRPTQFGKLDSVPPCATSQLQQATGMATALEQLFMNKLCLACIILIPV